MMAAVTEQRRGERAKYLPVWEADDKIGSQAPEPGSSSGSGR